MNKKKQFTGFVILSILILACQASRFIATSTPLSPTATATVTAPTSTATITFTPTPTAFLALQDSPIIFAAGGFNIAPLRGYKKEFNTYQAFLKSPDEKVTIYIQADPKPTGKFPIAVVKSYMEYFREGIHDFSENESQDIVIDSAKGVSQDFFGTVEEELLHGRISIVFPEDSKMLTIIVQTLGEGRWENEGEMAYSAMINKLTFFKPKISGACPIAKNPDYGYTVDHPIKIGGDESEGSNREQEYMSGLLGPRGEVVGYYLSESIEKNGAILDKYVVSYKNNTKVLYMDMYNYDNPRIPFGFTCSAIAPLSPE